DIQSFIKTISEKLKANIEATLTKELKENSDVPKLKQAINLKVEDLKQNKKWDTIVVSLYPDVKEILSSGFQTTLNINNVNLTSMISLTSTIVGGSLLASLLSSDFTGAFVSSVGDLSQGAFSDLISDIGGEVLTEIIEDIGLLFPGAALIVLGIKLFRYGRRIFGESKETKVVREMRLTISNDLENSINTMTGTINTKLEEAGINYLVSIKEAFQKSQFLIGKKAKKFRKYL
ncbi:MAG: hypothetical protein JWQ09_325, partial [Segetibacter sp.]|nr:hypothetical protein [Segetibacter sp.]